LSYKKLNSLQRRAVDAIDGPVLVIAGPGTGKTSILTIRIGNILRKTDTPPEAILALTFTESGVRAMRRKLAEIIGPTAYRVRIATFHSLSNDIIKTYPDKFPRIIGAEHVEALEQIRLVERLLEDGRYKILRPKGDPTYYVKKIIEAIKDLKREYITPEKFGQFIKSAEREISNAADLRHKSGKYKGKIKGEYQERLDKVARTKELCRAYRAYEKSLEKARLYDYEDMIIELVKRLDGDLDFRLRLQEEYQYILADEHQDANSAQNRMLELLSDFHEEPNLFVVGDEKQAIFRFQGASLENFLYFKKKFPKALTIVLDKNYRSGQTILDAAHSLISNSQEVGGNLRLPLVSASKSQSPKLLIIEAPDRLAEVASVAEDISKLLETGTPASEIAVLVRDNKHSELVERELRSRAIPVARFADLNALDHPYIDALLNLIRAACDPANEFLLSKAAFAPFLSIDPMKLVGVLSDRKRDSSLLETFAATKDTKSFASLVRYFASIVRSEPSVEAFDTIVIESGFGSFILSHSRSNELLPLYAGLLDAVIRHAERDKKATIADFISRLDNALKHDHTIVAENIPPDGVALRTAHGSKGLEFDHVFIFYGNDGVWGGRKDRHFFLLPFSDPLDQSTSDERRLFYVALTRARKSVTISYARLGDDGRERSPTRFIAEISDSFKNQTEAVGVSAKNRLTVKKETTPPLLKDKKYLQKLFLERGLSVTHLNNFLKCPWHYFFVDLLRIPKSQDNRALYGLAVHNTLKYYFDAYARNEDVSVKAAVKLFENYLFRTAMPERDFRDFVRDGKAELANYLSHYHFPRSIFNEFNIVGVPFKVGDLEIMLRGSLDKVELAKDGRGVNVVDYKTGRPKSRREILGETKSADGNYFRQLVFYRLLLDRYKKGEWRMETGTIDFIKPDSRGRFHREVFAIEPDDVKELEDIITESAKSILDLSFLNKTCDEENCEYCRLAKTFNL
jgi:DNA helicase-2/ATP-dependent DNA helicase PcrA